jgi:hypothetical protein
MCAAIAPRPLLLIAARHDDTLSWESTRAVYEELRHVYSVYGAEDRLGILVVDSFHGYTPPMRIALHRWLGRWWPDTGAAGYVTDPSDAEAELPHRLWCTPTGDTRALGSETVYSLNCAAAAALGQARELRRAAGRQGGAAHAAYVAALREGVRFSLLPPAEPADTTAAPAAAPPRTRHVLGTDEVRTEWVELEVEPDFLIQATITVPASGSGPSWPTAIWLDERSSGAVSAPLAALVRANLAVVTIAARWISPTMAYTFGRTELGMVTADVLAVCRWLRSRGDVDSRRIVVVGLGRKIGLVALFAATLDEGIAAAVANGFPPSLSELLARPDRQDDVMLLPGALRHFDVADLIAALEPRAFLEPETPEHIVEWLSLSPMANRVRGAPGRSFHHGGARHRARR